MFRLRQQDAKRFGQHQLINMDDMYGDQNLRSGGLMDDSKDNSGEEQGIRQSHGSQLIPGILVHVDPPSHHPPQPVSSLITGF